MDFFMPQVFTTPDLRAIGGHSFTAYIQTDYHIKLPGDPREARLLARLDGRVEERRDSELPDECLAMVVD